MAQTLEDKMKTMSGYCCVCGDTIIVKTKKPKDKLKDYRHHWIKLSNWTIMKIGICKQDKTKLTSGNKVQETADTALANHKIYWAEHAATAPEGYQSFTVLDPNTNLGKFKREVILKKHTEEVAKQEKDKAKK